MMQVDPEVTRRAVLNAVHALDDLVAVLSPVEEDAWLLRLAMAVVELEYVARRRQTLDLDEVRRAALVVADALSRAHDPI